MRISCLNSFYDIIRHQQVFVNGFPGFRITRFGSSESLAGTWDSGNGRRQRFYTCLRGFRHQRSIWSVYRFALFIADKVIRNRYEDGNKLFLIPEILALQLRLLLEKNDIHFLHPGFHTLVQVVLKMR